MYTREQVEEILVERDLRLLNTIRELDLDEKTAGNIVDEFREIIDLKLDDETLNEKLDSINFNEILKNHIVDAINNHTDEIISVIEDYADDIDEELLTYYELLNLC